MNTVTVVINGIEYNLRGKEDELYLSKVAAYVDNKIREISGSNKKLSTSSAAVLTAVNIADELFKCDSEIKDITNKKNSLEENNIKLEEHNLTLKERLQQLKNELDETIKLKTAEIESLNSVILEMESKLKDLENYKSINEDLTVKLKALNEVNINNESQITELSKGLVALKDENVKLEEKIKTCTDEINNRVLSSEFEEAIMKLEKAQEINLILSDENDDLKEKIHTYQDKINNYSTINSELKENELKLKEKIKFKEAELMEFKLLNEKQTLEEKSIMETKINSLELELKDALKKKDAYRLRNKDINFQLQNYKYKVLDLEKKLIDTQFNLAVEKREKNPLLR